MIRVSYHFSANGISDIRVEGHGPTLICAAISAAMQMVLRFLTDMAAQYPEHIEIDPSSVDERVHQSDVG